MVKMAGRVEEPSPRVVTNTSPTLERGRRFIQDRPRPIDAANEAGDEEEHQQQKQHVNGRPPEQDSQQPSCNPERQAQHAPRQGCMRTIDGSKILIHARESGGYVLHTRTPRSLLLRSSNRPFELFCGLANAE
jgi:hypothetical protein